MHMECVNFERKSIFNFTQHLELKHVDM